MLERSSRLAGLAAVVALAAIYIARQVIDSDQRAKTAAAATHAANIETVTAAIEEAMQEVYRIGIVHGAERLSQRPRLTSVPDPRARLNGRH